MICPYCGKEIRDEAQFCALCGHKIARCPSCNRVLRTRAKFCGFDGTLLPPELLKDLPDPDAAPTPPVVTPPPRPVPPPPPRPVPTPPREVPPPVREQTEERSRLPILLAAVLIVLLLAGAVVGVGIWQGWFSSGSSSSGEGTMQSDENGDAEEGAVDTEPEDDDAQSPGAVVEPEEEPDAEDEDTEVPVSERTYEIVASDLSWSEARRAALAAGGHLATITSQEEYDVICELAEDSGLKYLWLGAALTSDEMEWGEDGCWLTGESWSFSVWYPGEPSLTDADGTQEVCLCLWNAAYEEVDIGWTFNDQRDNLVEDFPSVSGKVGYVIEFDDGYTE